MLDLDALADVFQAPRPAPVPAALAPSDLEGDPSDPIETRPDWHGFTAGALQAAAGEDWPEIAESPAALAALALLLRTQAQRDRGELPEHYTSAALCQTCGPVWIYAREPGPLLACPWCMATKPGATVPRPSPDDFETDDPPARARCGAAEMSLRADRSSPVGLQPFKPSGL